MLKLLLNHWQDSHHKAPTRVQSEDPLLCTDLAKIRPDEEFSVSRVNPLFVDSSAETSPNFRLKGAKTIAQLHSGSLESDRKPSNGSAPSEPPDLSDKVQDQRSANLEREVAPNKGYSTAAADTAPKTVHEDQASDSGRESGSSPTLEEHFGNDERSSVASEASTSARNSCKTLSKPLVELREWEGNRGPNHLVKPGTAPLITREKIDLIEKVIAHRFSRQFSDATASSSILGNTNSSYLHSVRKAVVPQGTIPQKQTELPATKEVTGNPSTAQDSESSTITKHTPDQDKLEDPPALQLVTTPVEVSKDEISEVEANQEQTEVIAEIMPAVTRPDESSSSTSDSTTEKNADVVSKTSSSSGGQSTGDSGITRGDQVHTDVLQSDAAPAKASTKSDSSDQSSDSKTRKRSALKSKGLRNSQRQDHAVQNKLRCSFCRRNVKRHQRRISKHKHRSVAAPESGVVPSTGSLTDLALDHPYLSDVCPVHFHRKRSSISCVENCRDYPYEEFCNAVYRHPQGPMCNSDSCCYSSSGPSHSHSDCYHWEEVPRSRFSWNGGDDSTPCTCRRSHPAFSSRRKVKFAQRPEPQGPCPKDSEKDGEQESEEDGEEEEKDMKDDSVDGSACPAGKDIKTNGHVLMEGGMYDKGGVPVLPWHEWQSYVREKNLRARRKRALCMGVIALSIVVFVGVSVSVALAFLRKKF